MVRFLKDVTTTPEPLTPSEKEKEDFMKWLNDNTMLRIYTITQYGDLIESYYKKFDTLDKEKVKNYVIHCIRKKNDHRIKYAFKQYLKMKGLEEWNNMFPKLSPRQRKLVVKRFDEKLVIKIIRGIKKPTYQDIARLQVLSGARVGEILTLRKEFIDMNYKQVVQTNDGNVLTEGVYVKVRGKTGERHILFPTESKVIFKKYKHSEEDKGFLFLSQHVENIYQKSNKEDFYRNQREFYEALSTIRYNYWKHLKKSARSIEGGPLHFGTHELRRCFADAAYREGATIVELKSLLGHKEISTTSLYIPLYEEDLYSISRGVHNRYLGKKKEVTTYDKEKKI